MRALKGSETESEYRSIIRAEGSEREDYFCIVEESEVYDRECDIKVLVR